MVAMSLSRRFDVAGPTGECAHGEAKLPAANRAARSVGVGRRDRRRHVVGGESERAHPFGIHVDPNLVLGRANHCHARHAADLLEAPRVYVVCGTAQ
jgi:hypothetical protein